jgi:pyridoxamine 5'-phosphate oxidase
MTPPDTIKMLENAASGPEDPIMLFQQWLAEAESSEINDPNAMTLATIDENGRPAARIVLLKALDHRGFVFFTNRESRKGQALGIHPYAALNFHWKSLTRAVRIEGRVEMIDDRESDDYYNTRPRGSRIGAWASRQSRPLENRTTLQERVSALEAQYGPDDHIPRPPHWGGYRVIPDYIEFWHDGGFRLHTRLTYKKAGDSWERGMLYP